MWSGREILAVGALGPELHLDRPDGVVVPGAYGDVPSLRRDRGGAGASFGREGPSKATCWAPCPRSGWSRVPPPSRRSTLDPAGRSVSKVQSRKPTLNQLPASQSGTPVPSVEPAAERWRGTNPGR